MCGANSTWCEWVPKTDRTFELKASDLVIANPEARPWPMITISLSKPPANGQRNVGNQS